MILALCLPHLNFLKLLFTLKILHFLGLRTFFLGVLYIYIYIYVRAQHLYLLISLKIIFMNILMLNAVGHFSSECF